MPYKDPEKRLAYIRSYQREWWRRKQPSRRKRIDRLLREDWRQCIVGLFTQWPCRGTPKWRQGAALYCDKHKHPGAEPWTVDP